MEKNRIGYARTSRKDENITNQILAIRGRAGDIPVFADPGVSGIIPAADRPQFKRMMEYIEEHKGEIKELWVFEISRIGRSFLETLELVLKLESEGIRIKSVSPKESWLDIDDPSIRQLIFTLFSWVADREREYLIERTKAGQERAKAEGKKIGRPEMQINWREFDKYKNKGLSYSAISRIMDVSYPTLIKKIHERKGNNTP